MPWLAHQSTTLMPAGRFWHSLICSAHSFKRYCTATAVVAELIDLPPYSGIKSYGSTFNTCDRNIVYCHIFFPRSRGTYYLPFTVKKHQGEVLPKSQTGKAFAYSINQERYLRVFLKDGEVPLDNNATESALRGFCIEKHNWRLIDTIRGAKSSAIVYSITKTAKANNLKVYEHVEYLLTEIPKHEDDTNLNFLDDLLPWSPNLPERCRKSNKYEVK